jgi:hypothetical protein
MLYIQQNNRRTFPKSLSCPFRYRNPSGHQTGFTELEPLHSILLFKQLAERTEKEY